MAPASRTASRSAYVFLPQDFSLNSIAAAAATLQIDASMEIICYLGVIADLASTYDNPATRGVVSKVTLFTGNYRASKLLEITAAIALAATRKNKAAIILLEVQKRKVIEGYASINLGKLLRALFKKFKRPLKTSLRLMKKH